MKPLVTRRHFVRTLGTAALAFPFVSRRLISAPPSRMLRHASFGAAGMAWADIQAICSNPFVQLVAVAEVDAARLSLVKAAFPDVKVYQDWRQLLEREQIDSVNVSVPDHMHAVMALSALQRGKHCYCEKPLAHDLHETRVLTEYARGRNLVTQMGIQIHAQAPYRRAVALVQSGAIGKVKEVHVWSDKKWGDAGPPPAPTGPAPANFEWDLWLGTAAERPYVGGGYYHPGNWRKRLDFGTGTFGDMGCHLFDPVFAALALTAPLSLRSEGPAPDRWNWATNATIRYIFPGTKFTAGATVPVTWYDGDARPPREVLELVKPPAKVPRPAEESTEHAGREGRGPVAAPDARRAAAAKKRKTDEMEQGSIVIGTEGVLHIPHVFTPKLYPYEKFKDYPMPEVTGSHHWSDWAEACVGGPGKPLAPFDYSGPLTEAVLLGSVAVRFPQTTLQWNSPALRFDNEREANRYLRRTYRPGWEVPGL